MKWKIVSTFMPWASFFALALVYMYINNLQKIINKNFKLTNEIELGRMEIISILELRFAFQLYGKTQGNHFFEA